MEASRFQDLLKYIRKLKGVDWSLLRPQVRESRLIFKMIPFDLFPTVKSITIQDSCTMFRCKPSQSLMEK